MTNGAPLRLTLAGGQDQFLSFNDKFSFFDTQHITYENFADIKSNPRSFDDQPIVYDDSETFGRNSKDLKGAKLED